MNPADQDTLLDDLLPGEDAGPVRAGWEERTLRLVRRRRRMRRTAPIAAAIAALALFGGISRHLLLRKPAPVSPYTLVRTSPLPAGMIITTRLALPATQVESEHFARVVTTRMGGYRLLADGELLRLVAPRSGVLVQTGNLERLVFPDPDDAAGFPLN